MAKKDTLGALSGGAAMTNAVMPQPAAPVQMPPFNYQAPTGQTFTGQAPTPTAFGTFTAPDPLTYQRSPGFQAGLDAQERSLQRSAASRGTLLSGGFLNRMRENASDYEAQGYQNAFNRDLQAYLANRDTHNQNFNQQLGSFGAGLNAFNANTQAALGYGRLGLDSAQANRGAAMQDAAQQQDYQQSLNNYNAAQNAMGSLGAADAYAQSVEDARRASAAQNAAESARVRGGVAAPIGQTRGLAPTRGRMIGRY